MEQLEYFIYNTDAISQIALAIFCLGVGRFIGTTDRPDISAAYREFLEYIAIITTVVSVFLFCVMMGSWSPGAVKLEIKETYKHVIRRDSAMRKLYYHWNEDLGMYVKSLTPEK